MKPHTSLPIALAALALTASTGFSAPILEWGDSTSYVTSGKALRDIDGTDVTTSTFNRAYVETFSLTPISGFSGPALLGGWSLDSGGLDTISGTQFANNNASIGGNDGFLFRFNPASGGADMSIILADELASSVNLSDLQSFSIRASRNDVGSIFVRPVIRIGTSYYAGDTQTGLTTTYPASPVSLTLGGWIDYNPLSDIGDLSGSAASLTGTDQVNAVGFLIERPTGGSTDMDTYVGYLAVDAIPEPSSAALLLGVVAVAVAGLRRRR